MSANFTPNQNDYKNLTPFKSWLLLQINTWGQVNFPFVESDFDELTNYGMMQKLMNAVNDVISNENEVEEDMTNLFNAFTELQSYVNNYFNNLDVQEEINKKLDEMAEDGSLTGLIKEYIDPIQDAYETEVNQTISTQNARIATMENKIDAVTNGSPLPATDISDMTDTSKIYVLISTGNWYYYDGDSWEIGGEYQSAVEYYDTTLTTSNGVPESKSVGDRINQSYKKYNFINNTNITDNKLYNASGELENNNSFILFKDVIPLKENDTLFLEYVENDQIAKILIGYIIIVDAYGNFISRVTATSTWHYKATADCFVQINWQKSSLTQYDHIFAYVNSPNGNTLFNTSYIDKNAKYIDDVLVKTLNNNFVIYNYLDKNNCIINQNMDANGSIVYSSNGFFITNLIPVKNGDVVRFYNFAGTTSKLSQIIKYDEYGHFVERESVTDNTFTSDYNGYFIGNCTKPTASDDIDNLDITINREISQHYVYGYLASNRDDFKNIEITKNSSTNFTIAFDKFNVTLFKTTNSGTNANNWNLKDIKKGSNVLVPEGTDFIGPVKINENNDFIGGVHGDEITNHIYIIANGSIYKDSDIEDIVSIKTDYLTLIFNSDVYDQMAGDVAFERNVIINIYDNKIHVSNNYKAKKNLTLKTACVGGLIACRNTIITSIVMNNSYFDSAPTTSPNNQSHQNTYGVINTTYGSITINNIKGHDNPNYIGYLVTYSNESPIRNKIYFNTYHNGSYNIATNDVVDGEFEYSFN